MKKRFLNPNGQGSLEVMLIATAVIIMAFLFTSIFLTSQDSTTATVIAKNRLTEAFNLLDRPVIIQNIRYTIVAGNQIEITAAPSTPLNPTEQAKIQAILASNSIQQEIMDHTIFTTVNITVS